VGIIGNEKADKMAKLGTRGTPVVPGKSIAYAKQISKAKVQQLWREDWEEPHGPSGFDIADVNPPSVKPNETFNATNRELYGRVTQALTGHGYIGEYYRRFVPTESPWCLCSVESSPPVLQTREHIIRHCSRFAEHRPLLQDMPLSSLFDFSKGIHHFIGFLRKSGAFTKTGTPRPEPVLPPKKKPRDPRPP
jgi:hypothetical protein